MKDGKAPDKEGKAPDKDGESPKGFKVTLDRWGRKLCCCVRVSVPALLAVVEAGVVAVAEKITNEHTAEKLEKTLDSGRAIIDYALEQSLGDVEEKMFPVEKTSEQLAEEKEHPHITALREKARNVSHTANTIGAAIVTSVIKRVAPGNDLAIEMTISAAKETFQKTEDKIIEEVAHVTSRTTEILFNNEEPHIDEIREKIDDAIEKRAHESASKPLTMLQSIGEKFDECMYGKEVTPSTPSVIAAHPKEEESSNLSSVSEDSSVEHTPKPASRLERIGGEIHIFIYGPEDSTLNDSHSPNTPSVASRPLKKEEKTPDNSSAPAVVARPSKPDSMIRELGDTLDALIYGKEVPSSASNIPSLKEKIVNPYSPTIVAHSSQPESMIQRFGGKLNKLMYGEEETIIPTPVSNSSAVAPPKPQVAQAQNKQTSCILL